MNGRRLAVRLVGALAGGVAGVIIALNLVIYSGIAGGYEASIPQVFDENPVVGIIEICVLISGPIIGAVLADRLAGRGHPF